MRHITTAADANLGAITYHFGSKQGLYDAVLETVFGSLRERVGAAAAPDGTPPLERIERIARAVFSVLREDPDFPLLVVQQVSRMGELPGPALQTFPFVFNALMQVVAEGQADGSIRAGSPLLMAVSVISQPAYFGVVTRVLLSRLPSQFGGRPEWDEIEAHALHFIRRGLARRKEET